MCAAASITPRWSTVVVLHCSDLKQKWITTVLPGRRRSTYLGAEAVRPQIKGDRDLFSQKLARRRRSSRVGCSFTASKRPLPRLVGLPAGGSGRPLSPLSSKVAFLFARLPESYPPPSREVGDVVIFRCNGHPSVMDRNPTGRIHILLQTVLSMETDGVTQRSSTRARPRAVLSPRGALRP